MKNLKSKTILQGSKREMVDRKLAEANEMLKTLDWQKFQSLSKQPI
jgi:hypothetical protein